jgi:hypothetical protein
VQLTWSCILLDNSLIFSLLTMANSSI